MRVFLGFALVVSVALLGLMHFYPGPFANPDMFTPEDSSFLWNLGVVVAVASGVLLLLMGPSRGFLDHVKSNAAYLGSVADRYNEMQSEFSKLFNLNEARLLASVEKLRRKAEKLEQQIADSISPIGRVAMSELNDLHNKLSGVSAVIADMTGENSLGSKMLQVEELYKEIETSLKNIDDVAHFDDRLAMAREFVDKSSTRVTRLASISEELPALQRQLTELQQKLKPLADDNFGVYALVTKLGEISDEIERVLDNLGDADLSTEMSEVAGQMATVGSRLSGALAQLDTLKKNADSLQGNVVALQATHG